MLVFTVQHANLPKIQSEILYQWSEYSLSTKHLFHFLNKKHTQTEIIKHNALRQMLAISISTWS